MVNTTWMRDLIFKIRYGFRGVPIVIDGQRVRFDESLRRWNFESEVALRKLISSILKDGDTFVDVGANFGLHTLIASNEVGGNGCVIAFEPVPANVRLLKRHIQLNRCQNVRIVAGAVSNLASETIALTVPDDDVAVTASISSTQGSGNQKQLSVKNYRLDEFDFPNLRSVKLIKIDVEGAEFEVLKGAEHLLRRETPILVVEIHPANLPAFNATPELIFNFMKELGYGGLRLPGDYADGTYHVKFSKTKLGETR